MPYVVDHRTSGSRKTDLTWTRSGVTQRALIDSVTDYEVTYGFRSGRDDRLQKPDSRDVYMPPKGAGVAALLAYRKAFMERSVTKLSLDASHGDSSHFILSDMGNEFANTKLRAVGTPNRVVYKSTGLPAATTTIVNSTPGVLYSLDANGAMANGNPLTDFGTFFRDHGIGEFDGTGTHGLSQAQTNSISTSAIANMNPLKAHASVLTTLLELVRGDVPGVLKQLRQHMKTINQLRQVTASGLKGSASAVGGTYLENVFGWTPIMKDINAATQVLTTLDSLLFPPDNTRRTFARVIHERNGTLTGNAPLNGSGLMQPLYEASHRGLWENFRVGSYPASAGTAPSVFTARETIDIRCTARFNTSMSPTIQNNGYLDKMKVLVGLELTPEVVWNLVPWSWLVDWFANIGSVVENLGSIHMSNIILNYAYTTFRRETVSGVWSKPTLSGGSTGFQSLSGDFITEYTQSQKVRLKASPYGFGTALNSLSGDQWAILTALGLARQR